MKKLLTAGLSLAALAGKVAAADLPVKAPPQLPAYDWTGFYAGGHLGYAWGNSNWTTPGVSGSLDLAQPIDIFAETGSFFAGVQAGYNYMLPNRFVSVSRPMHRFRAFQTSPTFPSAAAVRRFPPRSVPKPIPRRYAPSARCAAGSATHPDAGCSTRPAVLPGLMTGPH